MAPKKAGKGPLHMSPRKSKHGPKTTVVGKKLSGPTGSTAGPPAATVAPTQSAVAMPHSQPVAACPPSASMPGQPATAAISSPAVPSLPPGPRSKPLTHAQHTRWLQKNLIDPKSLLLRAVILLSVSRTPLQLRPLRLSSPWLMPTMSTSLSLVLWLLQVLLTLLQMILRLPKPLVGRILPVRTILGSLGRPGVLPPFLLQQAMTPARKARPPGLLVLPTLTLPPALIPGRVLLGVIL